MQQIVQVMGAGRLAERFPPIKVTPVPTTTLQKLLKQLTFLIAPALENLLYLSKTHFALSSTPSPSQKLSPHPFESY